MSWSSLEKYCLRSRAMSPGYFCGCDLHDPAGLVLAGAIGEHRRARRNSCNPLMQASVCSGEFSMCDQSSTAGDAAVDRAERAEQVGGIDIVRASSWRRTCAARRCGNLPASRPAARCAGSPATCGGGYRRSPASRCGSIASITCAFGALMFGFTAEIFLPSISTSACSKSPTARSSESTQPPLIRIGRPAWAGLRRRLGRRRSRWRRARALPRRPRPWCKGTAAATGRCSAGSTDSRN